MLNEPEKQKEPKKEEKVLPVIGTEREFEILLTRQFDETILRIVYLKTEATVGSAKTMKLRDRGDLDGIEDEVMVVIKEPHAVVTANKIIFLNEKQKTVKELLFKDIMPSGSDAFVWHSKNGRFIGIRTNILKHADPSGGGVEVKLAIYDLNGEKKWEINISDIGYYSRPYISPDGKYVVCTGDWSHLYAAYRPSVRISSGEIIDLGHSDHLINSISIADSGDFFALTTESQGHTSTGRECSADKVAENLYVYDRNGKELWRKEKVTTATVCLCAVKIINNDTVILFTGQGEYKIYFWDLAGNLLKELQGNEEIHAQYWEEEQNAQRQTEITMNKKIEK